MAPMTPSIPCLSLKPLILSVAFSSFGQDMYVGLTSTKNFMTFLIMLWAALFDTSNRSEIYRNVSLLARYHTVIKNDLCGVTFSFPHL